MVAASTEFLSEGLDELFDMGTPSTEYSDQLASWDDVEQDAMIGTEVLAGARLEKRCTAATGADQFVTSIFNECDVHTFPHGHVDGENSTEPIGEEGLVNRGEGVKEKRSVGFKPTHAASVHYRAAGIEQVPPSCEVTQSSLNGGQSKDSGGNPACAGAPVSPFPSASPNGKREKELEGRKQAISRKHWTPEEEERFLKALHRFGPKEIESDPTTGRVSVRLGPGVAEMISMVVSTRSVAQVRSHVQKHYIRKEREASRRHPM
jgi:hypothetical protein